MAIILDVIILGIILLFGFFAAKKGFAKTLTEFVGMILAIVLSVILSNAASNIIYDKFVEPSVTQKIAETLEKSTDTSLTNTVDAVWNAFPKIVRNFTEKQGIGPEKLSSTITDSAISSTENTISTISKTATDTVVKPILKPLINLISGIIIFVILLIAVKFLSSLINKIFSFKLLGSLNKTLGFAIGILKGAIVSVLVVFVISSIVYLSENPFLGISNETINSTVIFEYISGFNPLIK